MRKMPLPDLPGYAAKDLENICHQKNWEQAHVRRLGRLLEYFSDYVDEPTGPTPEEFHNWISHVDASKRIPRTAHAYLQGTSHVFRHLYGSSPFQRALDAAIVYLWHQVKPKKDKADYKPKKLRFSVPVSALPEDWQEALADMQAGMAGIARPAPAPSMLKTCIRKICELAKTATDHDLELELTVETATFYEKSLLGREKPLSPVTIKSSVQHIRDFALYLGAPASVIEHLKERTRFHEARSARSMPQKERKLMLIPSYTEIFEHAFDLLGRADTTSGKRKAQKYRNYATALVLMCPFPLRVADTRLRFGEHITWNGEQYELFIAATSKTGEPFHARIKPFFGMFIDQLILQGADEDFLAELRTLAVRKCRPLFEGHGGDAVYDNYVSYAWRETYGTGSHIARTKIHDEMAIHGIKGVEGALRACGHRSERSAEHYRTRAFTLLAGDHVRQTAMNNISEDEWCRFFDAVVDERSNSH